MKIISASAPNRPTDEISIIRLIVEMSAQNLIGRMGVEAHVPFDPTQKFVRVNEFRKDGFVDFDFAVGEPELFVEMLLPAAAFDEFCSTNQVHFLGEATDAGKEREAWDWRLREARNHRF